MNKTLLCLSLALTAWAGSPAASAATDEPVTLYGLKTYCDSGASNGIYSVSTAPGSQPELYWADGDMLGSGGAVYAEGKFYVLSFLDYFGTLYWLYQICDPAEKTYEYSMPELNVSDVGSAMTYDPSTGSIYSICIDATDTSRFTLSTMDPATGAKTPVTRIERLFAMATTLDGVIYGIAGDGNLYTVDKVNGTLTLVGSTGVIPENNQSAVIDYKTNVMYWSAYTADGGALYTVDITTGKAELVSKYTDNFQLVGLYINQTALPDSSPASPTDLNVAFQGPTAAGTVSFVMPSTDLGGNQLTGDLTYEVKLDEQTLATGSAAPGAKVDASITSPQMGLCRFGVYVASAGGSAKPVSANVWVGPDTPVAVEDCTATYADGKVTLTWTFPALGVNGGYVDAAETRYKIIRGPYEELVSDNYEGTSYEVEVPVDVINPVMFLVSPIYNGVEGEAKMSSTAVAGDYAVPPLKEDFQDAFRSLVFTTEDVNNDDCSWLYDWENHCMKCEWPLADTSDDWFISAPLRLETGKTYSVSAIVRSEGKWNYTEQRYEDVYAGHLGIYLGDSPTSSAMATTLLEPFEVVRIAPMTVQTREFTVDETGNYHIGFHHTGKRSIYYTYLYSIEIGKRSSVENVGIDAKASVSVSGHVLTVSNPAAAAVTVVSVDGRVIATTNDECSTIDLAPGLYVVAVGGESFKVAVR